MAVWLAVIHHRNVVQPCWHDGRRARRCRPCRRSCCGRSRRWSGRGRSCERCASRCRRRGRSSSASGRRSAFCASRRKSVRSSLASGGCTAAAFGSHHLPAPPHVECLAAAAACSLPLHLSLHLNARTGGAVDTQGARSQGAERCVAAVCAQRSHRPKECVPKSVNVCGVDGFHGICRVLISGNQFGCLWHR
eukprot:SAG25_NODE_935_length_4674_cov_17.267541_4_plen_192_part_00